MKDETKTETKAVKANPMKEMVSLHIPKVSGEDRCVYIGLNGKAWSIPRGVTVQVPKPVADIYYMALKAAEARDKYIEAKQKDMTVVHGAPV